MAKKHYDWIPGDAPPVLGRHSLAKHTVLRRYLERYVAVLASRIVQDRLRLTLIDGFCGGGAYLHPDTNERLPGSPIIMLEAMQAAERVASAFVINRFILMSNICLLRRRLRRLNSSNPRLTNGTGTGSSRSDHNAAWKFLRPP